MKLDMSKFKKVGGDKDHTIMRHKDGHEMRIAHKALSPKMRGALAELPTMMADGGEADGTGPYVDPEKAKANAEDSQKSGWQPAEWSKNVKEFLGTSPSPAPKKMADGGDPAPDQSMQVATDPSQVQTPDAAPQPTAAATPITINVGQPSQAPQQPFTMPNMGNQPYGAPPQAPQAPAPESNAIPEAPKPAPAGASGSWDAPAPQAATQASIAPPQAPNGQPQGAASDPFGTQAYGDAYTNGLDEQKAGLMGVADAQAQEGKAQAGALQAQITAQNKATTTFNTHYTALDKERQAFQKDIQDQHIDPNHYLSSLGTGGRIATAIGLIFGGMPASNFLHQQIANDIEAQKAELGKKENLLSANFKQFGNLRDATDMTRVMQNDIVSNKLKLASAQAMTPMALARLHMEKGKLDSESAGILQQIAMRKTLLSGMQSGQVDPARVVNMVVPENQRAAANKELEDAQKLTSTRDNLLGTFGKLEQINTIGNRTMSPLQSKKQVDAMVGPLLAALSKDTAGRFTEADAGYIKPLFPAPGDNAETIATKKAQMNKLISEKMHFPILQTYGIDANRLGRFGAQEQSRMPESAPVAK